MILGGELTCPKCGQRDYTQRVSLVARQVNGNLSPAEIDTLTSQLQKGAAQDWKQPKGIANWEQLERKFRLPPAPTMPWWVSPSATTIRYGGFAVLVGLIAILYVLSALVPPIVVSLLAILIFGLPIFYFGYKLSFGASSARRDFTAKMDAWSKARSNWSRVWYCAHDNLLFVPADSRTYSIDELSTLLS